MLIPQYRDRQCVFVIHNQLVAHCISIRASLVVEIERNWSTCCWIYGGLAIVIKMVQQLACYRVSVMRIWAVSLDRHKVHIVLGHQTLRVSSINPVKLRKSIHIAARPAIIVHQRDDIGVGRHTTCKKDDCVLLFGVWFVELRVTRRIRAFKC